MIGIWDYRIIRHEYPAAVEEEKTLYKIHEVYYNEDSSLHAFRPASTLVGLSEDELRSTYLLMAEAFSKPPLNEKDFPSEGE